MRLKELIVDVGWEEVRESLIRNKMVEENSIEGYEYVFEKLLHMDATENDMKICVEWQQMNVEEGDDAESYWAVFGRDGTIMSEVEDGENLYHHGGNDLVEFALDFTPWTDWLGMEIDSETANNINLMKSDIIANILWEMTFISFDEEKIKDEIDEINKIVDNIKKESEDEEETTI